MFTPIPDHVAQAVARLVGQYANAERLKNLVRALVGPIQDIEVALEDMNVLRQLAVATGATLDRIGTIIGLSRPAGATDDEYRQLLYAQIKINTSEGQPEQVIQAYQLFTNATLVLLTEHYPASVTISSEYWFADQAEVDSILNILNMILPAGVRPAGLISFDATEAFAYDGALPGLGYGTDSDPLVGGKYATIRTANGFFTYAGNDPKGLGYGSTEDPLVGGWYASL